jgi:transcriptional regulator with XRE-family HTH domain
MTTDARLAELGEFFKARRAELSPLDVGLPAGSSPRRVPGLRREEVAQLAAISTDYYTRIEQGRMQASAAVLVALARVLRLNDDQQSYVFGLAGKGAPRQRRRARQQVHPQLRRLLGDLFAVPAVVLGRRMDILAWNAQAAALITDFARIPEEQRNYIRMIFTDPVMRTLYRDWENVARTCVATLRMEAAENPQDPRLAMLVGELSVRDPDFRAWWGSHQVATLRVGTKLFRHPVAGDLTLDWETLATVTDPRQQLVYWTAEPGSPSHDALRILASWAATHLPEAEGVSRQVHE